MADKRDYYDVLKVSRQATTVEIKKSFRRLAMKYHPDRNPGDEEAEIRFKEAREAYEILSDEQKRSAYDQFGHAGVEQQFRGGAGGFDFSDLGDIFGDIFGGDIGDIFGGGRKRSQRQQRGADLGYELHLSLEEAVHGITKSLEVPTWVSCKRCDGSGAKDGSTGVTTCQTCQGAGHVQMQHGFLSVQQTCSRCHGSGQMIKDPCQTCRGQGRVQETKTLSVKIPAGIDTGDRIRLSGEGEAGVNGAPAGDLYVQVVLEEHELFMRDGNDLMVEVPIDFTAAVLGSAITVPTLSGDVTLDVPPGTQYGKTFRLRGKGVKALRSGGMGDLICRIVIETPVNLGSEQKDLLKQFSDSLEKDNKNHSPRKKGWFDKVKEFFTEGDK